MVPAEIELREIAVKMLFRDRGGKRRRCRALKERWSFRQCWSERPRERIRPCCGRPSHDRRTRCRAPGNAVFVGVDLGAVIDHFADRGLDVLSSDVGDDATTESRARSTTTSTGVFSVPRPRAGGASAGLPPT